MRGKKKAFLPFPDVVRGQVGTVWLGGGDGHADIQAALVTLQGRP